MKRVRTRVKQLVGTHRNGVKDVRVILADLSPVLRGWGNYFRTGNAAEKFNQIDSYVWRRLRSFMKKRKGRHLRYGDLESWNRDFFWRHGLHRLRGTVKYPEAA
jgi:RNA-directed DNA polymerase